jgi:AcrR family transcriptional regulator
MITIARSARSAAALDQTGRHGVDPGVTANDRLRRDSEGALASDTNRESIDGPRYSCAPQMVHSDSVKAGDGDGGTTSAGARERILDAAYELFSARGIQAVGIDAVITRSGVARQTLYRHFSSKQELVLAFLKRREELWTEGWLQAEVLARAANPAGRLLAIFDVFDEWFRRSDFEGCSFINVLLEHPDSHDAIHRAGVEYLARIRGFLEGLVAEAGIPDAEAFAREWHILMKGSIVAAAEGDREAAGRSQRIGSLLLQRAVDGGSGAA